MRRNRKPTSDAAEADIAAVIDQVSRDRGLDPAVLITAIEDALQAAAQTFYGEGEKVQTRFNRERGAFEVFTRKAVVENVADASSEISVGEARKLDEEAAPGSFVEIRRETDVIGRMAAQTAKQVIATRMREVENENIAKEYNEKAGQLCAGFVRRFDGEDLVLDFGRTEALLPRKEQNPLEHYEIGDRVRAVVLKVVRNNHDVTVIVSRADPSLITKLLESEVPEIRDRIVTIRGVAREAGERSKVAVSSKEKSIDPVGACVGVKGTRIQAVIRELRGERIDVIEWSGDPTVFIGKALSPAKVRRVNIRSSADRSAEVEVDDKQLSLAIGKRGQNVRLASRLTGWHIDIAKTGGGGALPDLPGGSEPGSPA